MKMIIDKTVTNFSVRRPIVSPFLVEKKGGATSMDEENTTTLLRELSDFNDVPLTAEDREEMQFYSELRAKEKEEEKAVVAQVLREAGVNIYANEDSDNFC